MPDPATRSPRAKGLPVPITMGSPQFETVDAGPFRVTRASFVGCDVLEPHTHDRTTFALILAGGFQLGFANPSLRRRTHDCLPGVVFTEPAGETHSNRILDAGASVLVIQADPADDSLGAFDPLLDEVHSFAHAGVESSGRQLVRELAIRDGLTSLSVHALAVEMLVAATRRVGGQRQPRARGRPRWLRTAEDYVREGFRRPLRLDDVARESGVSSSHLAAVFRAAHGVSIGEYVRALRIDWAADRLASGAESIAAIALQAGFSDQAHLTRAFKRATGYTPARWRRMSRAG